MESEKQLIDLEVAIRKLEAEKNKSDGSSMGGLICGLLQNVIHWLSSQPRVDAVEVEDKELLKAIKILVEQYGHSKRSEYVHSPVAHALYHTWKKVDEDGRRKERQ